MIHAMPITTIGTTLDATFENGVFVPMQRPILADHERVRLTIEPISALPQRLKAIGRRCGRRIRLAPSLAREIAVSPEFHPHEN